MRSCEWLRPRLMVAICAISTGGYAGALTVPPAVALADESRPGVRKIEIEQPTNAVGRYEKLELLIRVHSRYDNPFDPNQVDVTVRLKAPGGEQLTAPAFYCQNYERRKLNQDRGHANWYYLVGRGVWKVRFAPTEIGRYVATARLKDRTGAVQSESVQFDCVPSSSKGFLRISHKDPRFFEFSDGSKFFSIGQDLAFVGEGQYVNLTKAEQIFGKLHANGANFLRIWTCCGDWAMAIEAKKSAWDRSWQRNVPIVPIPGSESDPHARKCVKIEGADGTSLTVSPSHPVALRPKTRYVLSGRFTANGPSALRVSMGGDSWEFPFKGTPKKTWQTFRKEFVAGDNEWWLGKTAVSLVGAGTIWLEELSLKEAPDGPELLWEADVNRPIRGVYNQLDCFMLDKLVEAAEQNHIYLMLCVLTRDLYMKDLSNPKSVEYNRAIRDAKKFMRYAVARWGYSTNVAAWEYFNEINPHLPTERFYKELGEYLDHADVDHHLRTTSTWSPSARDCGLPQLDIAQVHHYLRPGTKEQYKDEVAAVVEWTQFLRKYAPDKPALIGEFGLATPKWGLSNYMKQDEKAVHFHNSLWASAFAGTSGTAMFWWWDQLDRQDAYHHYRPLSAFLGDVSFVGLKALEATAGDDRLRLLGYQGDDCAYVWIFDTDATWWNQVVEMKQPAPITNARIEIQGLRPGHYSVEWWDTHKSGIVRTENVSCTQEPLQIPVPSFSGDIACKVRREACNTQRMSRGRGRPTCLPRASRRHVSRGRPRHGVVPATQDSCAYRCRAKCTMRAINRS
jgi:Domain of unknown function (DUF5060)